MLQHGSLPLAGDLTRLVDCLALPAPAEGEALRRSLADHATTVERLLGRRVSYEEAAQAMVVGFTAALDLELTAGVLTDAERGWAGELLAEKYDNWTWTART